MRCITNAIDLKDHFLSESFLRRLIIFIRIVLIINYFDGFTIMLQCGAYRLVRCNASQNVHKIASSESIFSDVAV